MIYGFETKDVNDIVNAISLSLEVEKAILYGSRAKGSYRERSDVDICLFGPQLNLSVINEVSERIYNLNLPYLFDLSIYHQISNTDLLEHIRRVGVVLFDRTSGIRDGA